MAGILLSRLRRRKTEISTRSQRQRGVQRLVDGVLRLGKRAQILGDRGAQERIHPLENVVFADRAAHPAHARQAITLDHVTCAVEGVWDTTYIVTSTVYRAARQS